MRDFHAIERAWEDFIAYGQCTSPAVMPPLLRSWQSSRERQVSPDMPPRALPTFVDAPVLALLTPLLEDIYEFLEGTSSAILLCTAEAVVVELIGDTNICESLNRLNLGRGADWSEGAVGTNAFALVLQEGHPLSTIGPEHYCRALHGLAVSAAPFFDVEGKLLGAVGIVTFVDAFQQHALASAAVAAQSIQTRLQMESLLKEANHRLTELNAAIEAMTEGLMLIGADDRIVRLNQRVEQILGCSSRAAAGRPLRDVVPLPEPLQRALELRTPLPDRELLFQMPYGTLAIVCSLKPIYRQGQYLGSLLTFQPPEHVHSLAHQVFGSHAHMSFRDMIGESDAIQLALSQARVAANGMASVLLVGEHGTGKELLAHAIHHASVRAAGPFVSLDCATIPRSLIGMELFGFESTDDDLQRGRPGKLELAHGGTLLIKGVEALPMEEQTALLRAIESRSTIRTGGRRVISLDVRIITTTVNGLGIAGGHFRADLAARLSTLTIELPPLRARGQDVLLFINQLLESINQRLGKQIVLSPDALQVMLAYPWPGNIRELEAVLEQITHTTEQSIVQVSHLPAALRQWTGASDRNGSQLQKQYDHIEREAILRAGRAAGGHLLRTAQQLGISRTTLWRKMQEHGLSRTDFWAAST